MPVGFGFGIGIWCFGNIYAKIVNTEWEVTGRAISHDVETGDYLGSMVGGIDIAIIGDTDIQATFAPMLTSELGEAQVLAGATATWIMNDYTKGSRKNNFTELAPRFRLALSDPKSQNHSNSRALSRILRLRIGQR